MPNYEYECTECNHRFERLQRFSDPPVDTCPQCRSAVRRVLHPVGIVFKGSGWYVTDSRSSDSATSTPTEKGEKGEKADTSAEDTRETSNAKGDSKDGAKSEAKPAAAGSGE